jgi:hypothetical protein
MGSSSKSESNHVGHDNFATQSKNNTMKTTTLSIATVLLIVFSVNTNTFAAGKANKEAVTNLTEVTSINQIEVHGNVELYITSGESDKVKVYDSYYNQNALVQEQNGTLRIASYKNEKLVVWVTVNNLHAISAYDDASVNSFGKFSALELNLSLNNNATANFDMDCGNANIAVNDNAKANITGYAAESYMVVNQSATINATNFVADERTQKRITPVTAAIEIADDLVTLN